MTLVEVGFVYMSPRGDEPLDGLAEDFYPSDPAQWEGSGMKTVSVWLDGADGKELWFSCN